MKETVKRNLKKWGVLPVLLFLASPVLPAQGIADARTSAETGRLAALDGQVRWLGIQIAAELNSRGDRPRLRTGPFTRGGGETPLGLYWGEQLSKVLSEAGTKNFTLLEPEPSRPERGAPPDYELSGEIVVVGETLRIYTRLVRLPGGELEHSWTSDLAFNSFLADLVETAPQSSSSGSPRIVRDPYEEDSIDHPVNIETNGSWMNRTLHQGDEDWFRIVPAAPGFLIVETGGDMDTYMELFDGDTGVNLAEDDDGGEDYNARIEYTVLAGKTYIVKVRPLSNDATGNYRFRAAMETFPPESVTEVETGEAWISRTSLPGGGDWFRVVPATAGLLVMETGGDLDTVMELYDGDTGTKLAQDDDGGEGSNARIEYNAGAGKAYIIKVRPYGRSETSSYRFRAAMETFPPESLIEVEAGEAWISRTFGQGDRDWFRIVPAAAGLLVMETGGDRDTVMELYDGDTGTKLAEDDDGGEETNARIEYSVRAGKSYIVKVRPYNRSETGNYRFRALMEAFPPESVTEVETGEAWISRTLGQGDRDWFRIVPAATALLALETGGAMDTFMELYDGDTGTKLTENDDGGEDGNALIECTVTAGKPYFVKVRFYNRSDEGGYRFRALMETFPPESLTEAETGGPWINRTSLPGRGEWFRVVPAAAGRLVMETGGDRDTIMELYDGDTGEKLAEDDDGGEETNARIEYSAEAGKPYIIKVSPYGRENSGNYRFRTFIRP